MFFERGKGTEFTYSVELALPEQILSETKPSGFDKTYEFSKSGKIMIPVSVFRQGMSGLRSIVKYLLEMQGLSYAEIASILSRDQRTIWSAYKSVEKKAFKDASLIKKDSVFLDSGILTDRNLSVLEATSIFLKRKGYSLTRTAELLDKNPKTVWTVLNRAEKKMAINRKKARGGM